MASILTQFLDRCIWTPASSGTGSFVLSAAVTGFQTMAAAGAVNGTVYGYAAQSADLSQWEVGYGTWTSGTSTLTRTVLYNSLGTTAAVSFTVPPQVMITAIAETLVGFDSGFSYAGAGQVTLALGTITANANALSITGTWNNSGVTFDAPLFMNITNTASATASLLMDLQKSGTTQFAVLPNSSATSSAYVALADATAANFAFFGWSGANIVIGSSASATSGGPATFLLGINKFEPGLSGTPNAIKIATGAAFAWANAGSPVNSADTALFRIAARTVGLAEGTHSNSFQVYNTIDGSLPPTNYERGVFDWTTTANTLTIGTQAGGTGTARNLNLVSGDVALIPHGSGYADWVVTFPPGLNQNVIALGTNGGTGPRVTMGANGKFQWTNTNSDALAGPDTGLSRNAAGVVTIGNGSAGDHTGYLNWGGQVRVTSDFTVTSSTALTNVTGLSVSVQAGRTYTFETELFVTDAAAGGVQAAIAGTATATAIQYTGYTIADNAIKAKTNATALATAVGSTVTTETSGIIVRITGTITVNAAGTLTVQMAQNTSNGTATTAKRGSYLIVHDMP